MQFFNNLQYSYNFPVTTVTLNISHNIWRPFSFTLKPYKLQYRFDNAVYGTVMQHKIIDIILFHNKKY